MQNQVVTSASPEWTRWLERMSSWRPDKAHAALGVAPPSWRRRSFAPSRVSFGVRQLAAAFHRELARSHLVSEVTPASKLACNKAAASCRFSP